MGKKDNTLWVAAGALLALFLFRKKQSTGIKSDNPLAPTLEIWSKTNPRLTGETNVNYCLRYSRYITSKFPNASVDCRGY